MPSTLTAGAAKIDITPPLGTVINGDFITHYARIVHDPLYAKALVLQYDHTTIVLVIVDICAMPKDFLDPVKAGITEKTGIPYNNILISATHTHASGSITDVHLVGADITYRKKLQPLLIQVVQDATKNCRPARIAFGAVDVPEFVLCRRYFMKDGYQPRNPVTGGTDQVKTNPFKQEHQIDRGVAEPDPQLSYLAVQGTDGEWISLFANYSLHYIGDWENGSLSADYFGEFANRIQQKLQANDSFIGVLSNGTSGDINLWDFMVPGRFPTGTFQKTELIASTMAEKVFQSLQEIEWETTPAISVQYAEVLLNIRKPTPQELEAAKAIVNTTCYEEVIVYGDNELNDESLQKLYAREQILLSEFPDTQSFPVQALKIGNGIIGALAGEFFAETGLWLKAQQNNNVRYFTVCLSNGFVGYVPPSHEIEKGGYETWRCRSSFLEMNAENQIREKLVQLIYQFK